MTRWFRFYDDAVNDPKVQRLAGETFKAWVNILCLASKNNGLLPSVADISYTLRLEELQVSDLLNNFYKLQLIDEVEVPDAPMAYMPHNWCARQYKSDVTDPTAPDRQKRYRDRKRNDRNATVTVTATRAETEADTEQKEDAAEAAPGSEEKQLYDLGKQILGATSGGLVKKLVTAKDGSIPLARAALEVSRTKSNPREYLGAIIRSREDAECRPDRSF